jgi:hypothetical protein
MSHNLSFNIILRRILKLEFLLGGSLLLSCEVGLHEGFEATKKGPKLGFFLRGLGYWSLLCLLLGSGLWSRL